MKSLVRRERQGSGSRDREGTGVQCGKGGGEWGRGHSEDAEDQGPQARGHCKDLGIFSDATVTEARG